jgi:hypothetical protein
MADRFAVQTQYTVGNAPSSILVNAWRRYSDSRQDIAVANYTDGTVSILLYAGAGTFTNAIVPTVSVGSHPASMFVGDFNGDGKKDIVVANTGDNTVNVLLGDGAANFTNANNSPFGAAIGVGNVPYLISVDNFRGGFQDIAVANKNDNTVSILLGNGDGTFATAPGSPFPVGLNPVGGASADLNRDGKTDVIVANFGDGSISIFLGNGDGTFTQAAGSPIAIGVGPMSIATGDFNNDGNIDLAVARVNDNAITILIGAGNGTFAPAAGSPLTTANGVGQGPACVRAYDMAGDANLDLAVANNLDGTVSLFIGNGDGSFQAGAAFPVGANPTYLYPRNVDPGTAPDLVVANFGANTISVLLDNTPQASPLYPVVNENSSVAVTLAGSVRGGASLTYTVLASPTNGLLSGTAPNLSYTPNAFYFGADHFTYKSNDGTLDSATADVTISVKHLNQAPSFTDGPNLTISRSLPKQTFSSWATNIKAGPPNESSQTVSFIVTNNFNSLFLTQPAITAAGTLTFQSKAGSNGVSTVTLRLKDNGTTAAGETNASPFQSFTITVQ